MSISSHELSNSKIYSAEGDGGLACSMEDVRGTNIQPTEEQQVQGSIHAKFTY